MDQVVRCIQEIFGSCSYLYSRIGLFISRGLRISVNIEVYILSPRSPYISLFTKIFGEQVSIGRLDMPLVTIVQGVWAPGHG